MAVFWSPSHLLSLLQYFRVSGPLHYASQLVFKASSDLKQRLGFDDKVKIVLITSKSLPVAVYLHTIRPKTELIFSMQQLWFSLQDIDEVIQQAKSVSILL